MLKKKIFFILGILLISFSATAVQLSNQGKGGIIATNPNKTSTSSSASSSSSSNSSSNSGTLFDSTKAYPIGSNKVIDSYSTEYRDNAKLISKGGCQLIAYKGAPFRVMEVKPGKYELVKSGASGQGILQVDVERITNPEHPFFPRNSSDWQERQAQDPDTGTCFPPSEDKKFTNLCGKEKLKNAGNVRAWENGPLKVDGIDFEYYKIPIQDKKGKILVTPSRKSSFDTKMRICYEICKRSTYNVGGPICCDICQYQVCRSEILPPEKPVNILKMSYGMFTDKVKSPNNINETKYSKDTNGQLPRVYDSERKSYPNIYNNGLGFATSAPEDLFGYNMPTMMHFPTGDAGSAPLIELFKDRKKWEPWRQTIAGVNSYFRPDESNPTASGVFNKSGQIGGWNELVLYQARCQHLFGLNCICDYFQNFYKGSSLGYALSRFDSSVSLNNAPQVKKEKASYGGKDYMRKVDKSDRLLWKYEVSFLRDKYSFPGLLGHNILKQGTWPGQGQWLITGGLSQAKKGDIIFYDEENSTSQGSNKRRFQAAFVEDDPRDKGGQLCIKISEADGGTLLDSAGSSENWGNVSIRYICNGTKNVSSIREAGNDQLKGCTYGDYQYCHEEEWDKWKIYRPYDFTDPSKPRLVDNRTHETRIDIPDPDKPTYTTSTTPGEYSAPTVSTSTTSTNRSSSSNNIGSTGKK